MTVSGVPEAASPLEEARALAAARDWRALVEWGAPLADGLARDEPEAAYYYADACRRTGLAEAALDVMGRVEPRVRQGGDRHLLLRAINLIGITLFESGRIAEAEGRFAELLDAAANDGADEFVARASNNMGMIANIRGARDVALAHYQRAIAGYRREGNQRGLAQTHYNLGLSFRDLGFGSDADGNFRRAIELGTASNTEEVVALAETERAMLRAQGGDAKLAETMARRALGRFEAIGDPTGAGQAMRVLAAAARARGAHDEAERRLGEALEIAAVHADPVLRADVQKDLGLLLRDLGRVAEAGAALEDAAGCFERIGAVAEAEALRAIVASLEA